MWDDLEACEPDWLAIVFCGKDTAVEEDKKKDDPKHGLCLDCSKAPLLCRFNCPKKLLSPSEMDSFPLISFPFPAFMHIPHKVTVFKLFCCLSIIIFTILTFMQDIPACSTSLGSFSLPGELPTKGSQDQIDHKESAKEDEGTKEDRREESVRSILNPVEDVGPAFQGDALEDGKHGLKNVVEAGHPLVGSNPTIQACKILHALASLATGLGILNKFVGDVVVTGIVEHSGVEFKTNDGIDEDDKEDKQCNMEEWDHGLEDWVDDNLA